MSFMSRVHERATEIMADADGLLTWERATAIAMEETIAAEAPRCPHGRRQARAGDPCLCVGAPQVAVAP